jgi:antitoxin PrlF
VPKTFINSAKVTIKSQVTIPKDVREILGVTTGDQVSFIVEGNTVRLVNPAVYAMQILQKEMAGEAKRKKLKSDTDIMKLVKKTRVRKAGT